jgi:hypothetical protein
MDVRRLIDAIARKENELTGTRFVAPCVRGGTVRTKVAGLVYAFSPEPADFEGWGLFEPVDRATARLVEEADLPLVDRYLGLLGTRMRFVLGHRIDGRTWSAYPANESDAKQRGVGARPVIVRLVADAAEFEVVLARFDGAAWWFEGLDRRADPVLAESLRAAMRSVTPPEAVRARGLTPEMRTAYGISTERIREFRERMEQARAEARLGGALRLGGGRLVDFRDRDDVWVVEWTTSDGERHTSIVTKEDLSVVSSGICLSGRDRDFDLQSLVGVIEQAW